MEPIRVFKSPNKNCRHAALLDIQSNTSLAGTSTACVSSSTVANAGNGLWPKIEEVLRMHVCPRSIQYKVNSRPVSLDI